MSSSHGNLHHIELYVSNLPRSLSFWAPLLQRLGYVLFQNWKSGQSWKKDGTYLVFVQTEEKFLEAGFHRKRTGLNHLAFHVSSTAELASLSTMLSGKGAVRLYAERAQRVEEKNLEAVYFEDPDRIKVELVAPVLRDKISAESFKIISRALNFASGREMDDVALIHAMVPLEWNAAHKLNQKFFEKTKSELQRAASGDDAFLRVAVFEDEIVGFHWMEKCELYGSPGAYIKSLWVKPAMRGQGIATRLKVDGEKWALSKGARCISTTVNANNQRMMDFNRQFGFQAHDVQMIKDL